MYNVKYVELLNYVQIFIYLYYYKNDKIYL